MLPLRLARLILQFALGGLLVLWLLVEGGRRVPRERLVQIWCRQTLGIFRVRLRVEGQPLDRPNLTVANHVSWMDICVLGALSPSRFVAKSDVGGWPVIGSFARAAGTLFIRRGRGGAAPLLERLTPALRAGDRVVVFPEGTTTDGSAVRPFHPRLFEAAIEARRPVQPVTLRYGLDRDGRNIAPYIGDDTLVPHMLRLLAAPGLEVRVIYGPPISPADRTREALAAEAESFVRAGLPAPHASPPRERPDRIASPA